MNPTFTDLYIRYAQEQTDAPPIFHRFLSYMIVSSIVNKNAYFQFGYKKLYPNLYLLIVAPSSAHRKSWSISIASRMIARIHPSFKIPETSSREAFIAELCDPNRPPMGCGMIEIDEFKGFMDRCKKKAYMEGFLQDISSLYDGHDLNRRKGVSDPERYQAKEPFLNFVAACSNDWLYQAVESGDIQGGFLARFIWVVYDDPIKNPKARPGIPNSALEDLLIEKLARISQFIGRIDFNADASIYHERWHSAFFSKHQGGFWDQNYYRSEAIIEKIATLNALMRVESKGAEMVNAKIEITIEDLKMAILLIEDTHLNYKKITIGGDKIDTLSKKVLTFILKKEVSNRKQLLQGIRNLNSKNLDEVLSNLIQAGAVESFNETASNGKIAQYIRPTEDAASYLSR